MARKLAVGKVLSGGVGKSLGKLAESLFGDSARANRELKKRQYDYLALLVYYLTA